MNSNQYKEIPKAMLMAAEDTISTFLIETNEIRNDRKIMEFSFLMNSFIHHSGELQEKIEKATNDDEMKNISEYIFQIIKNKVELYSTFEDYSEFICASYILSINECEENLENFNESEIHRNLILHFLTIIPLQNTINKGEKDE